MSSFQTNIDNMISKILKEEIDERTKEMSDKMVEGEWTEIELGEKYNDGRDYIAKQAPPKNKITSADFKKLRSSKKETKEATYFEDEFIDDEEFGDYEGDEKAENKAQELSLKEPTYVGSGLEDNKAFANLRNKIFGSFEEQGDWYDEKDVDYVGQFDFDFDEEEFEEFEPFFEKYGKHTNWFAPGEEGKKFFNMYKDRFGPMKVRTPKNLDENDEFEEGNKFSKAVVDAKRKGKKEFELDGETYPVTESEKKWIQKTDMKKGELRKKLGVPEGEKIPKSKLKTLKKELMSKAKGKKLSVADNKLLKQVNLALTLGSLKENKTIQLAENELVDLIENIVLEAKNKETKSNIKKQEPIGLKKTNKVLQADRKENENYAKEVVEKMKNYLKKGSVGEFKESPENFPESNYTLGKMKEKTMKYHPSDAVDEYIEAFAYPGQTNLTFDEIKPDEEMIEKYLKGHRTTGNAELDEDGKALGNVVPGKAGEKFMKNFKENLYGAEQKENSYKRFPQDTIEVAGHNKKSGKLSSLKKDSKIFNALESVDEKGSNKINEDISKIKNLIGYNTKTQ